MAGSGGYYTFLSVAPGSSYYVAVVKASVSAQCGLMSSPGGGDNPDTDDEDALGGDDGVPGATPSTTSLVVSGVLNATVGGQTLTGDQGDPAGYPDNSAYMTVDFGFVSQPTAVQLGRLQANSVTLLQQLLGWLQR